MACRTRQVHFQRAIRDGANISRFFLYLRSLLRIVIFAPFWLANILFRFFASQLRWYAILGIILGGLMALSNLLFLNKAVVVTGIHTRYETTHFARWDHTLVRPRFRYFDPQGNRLVNATSAVPLDYLLTKGDAVMLLMDPNKPSHIEIEAGFNPLTPGGSIAGFGLLMLFLPRWIKQRWTKWRRNRPFPRSRKPPATQPDRRQNESPTIKRMR